MSYLLLHSYIKGSEDKEPDFENIILLKIYPFILTTSLAGRERSSIHYLDVLLKRDLLTSSSKDFLSTIRQGPGFPSFSFSIHAHLSTLINGTSSKIKRGGGD